MMRATISGMPASPHQIRRLLDQRETRRLQEEGNAKQSGNPGQQVPSPRSYRRGALPRLARLFPRHRPAAYGGQIADDLYHIPYEPYAPVRQQMLRILKLVNQSRKAAGRETLGYNVLRYRRRIVRPFEAVNLAESA